MNTLLLAGFCALQASFIWARFAVFRIDGNTPPGARMIEVSTLLCLVAGIVLILRRSASHPIHPMLDVLALLACAASAVVFGWAVRSVRRKQLTAAFSGDAPGELLRSGAFAFVRNPFYLSYLLAHALPLLASWSLWGAVTLSWMVMLYCRAVALEERKFLAGPLAGDYLKYVRQTGRFLPRLALRRKSAGVSA